MSKNKRGQFYIIFIVLIVVIISGLITTSNYARRVKDPVKFYDLSEDFEAETTKIIDYGIFSGESQVNINELINNFSAEYLEYVQKKDPNLELIYIFGNENDITIDNYYYEGDEIKVKSQTGLEQEIEPGSEITTSKITIHYGEKEFTRDIGERVRYYAEVSQNIKEPGKWIQVEIAGIVHDFQLGPNLAFYYVISTTGEEKEIHVVENK